MNYLSKLRCLGFTILAFILCLSPLHAEKIELGKGERIVLIGNGLGSRMMNFGYFESTVQLMFPEHQLVIRNMCDEGNTPGFRPHPGRPSPWAFPDAEKFGPKLSETRDRWRSGQVGTGQFPTPDEWLTKLQADTIIAFFGYNESFAGLDGLEKFKGALDGLIRHTKEQKYNGESPPRLILVSPTAFEDLSSQQDTPDGQTENGNLALYTAAMQELAEEHSIDFINMFSPSQEWMDAEAEQLTRDGALLNDKGYRIFSRKLCEAIFGARTTNNKYAKDVLASVLEKNWIWHNFYKIPNGVHVFGRRHKPFGPKNYPDELIKLEEMTSKRDEAIWAALRGAFYDLAAADANTHELPEIETNYRPSKKNGATEYKYGKDALESFETAPGYKIELFASEKEFPNLANPVQMSFDNKGRLWVATMPSYPHYKPGDPKPDDKLLIFEDSNNDGKADKEIVFADGLHLPTGFEFAPEGVYVAQLAQLILLKDEDGDDKADSSEVVMGGFDDHDSHHVISAFCADPSGAFFLSEGTFIHSNVETAYGPIRSSNGGFFRYNPQRHQLERTARISIPNPWGTAVDSWGQIFFLETSDASMNWFNPMTSKVRYGEFTKKVKSLIEKDHRVRPTSGLEVVSSRHFPEEVQGDILLNNTIGYLGTKQHTIEDDGTGYKSSHRQDLVFSKDGNYRPVDLEFAPDGSLYIVDWHNVLVGHMQHNARDPLRDHVHGRVYRITYPSRPLVQPAKVDGASIAELLENLKLHEDRTRYRTRRELRGREPGEVLAAVNAWTSSLDSSDINYEHQLLEALWVTWGLNQTNEKLLRRLLKAESYKARAAAVRVLRYSTHLISDHAKLLYDAAQDEHGRVRMEAVVAASWLEPSIALPIIAKAKEKKSDESLDVAIQTAEANLKGETIVEEKEEIAKTDLKGLDLELYTKGAEVYSREGHCVTCHQPDGEGLPAAQFPPISNTQWVQGDPERLIKLTLHGLLGPIEVKGKKYPGHVPMTQFKGLSDEEIAAVLTYVRNSFGNKASPIYPDKVAEVREKTKDQKGFYSPEELLKN